MLTWNETVLLVDSYISKDDAIDIMNNSDLIDKMGVL